MRDAEKLGFDYGDEEQEELQEHEVWWTGIHDYTHDGEDK